MAFQSVTLDLPDAVYERLQHAAATLNRPLEEVVFQSIQGNLPPSLDDLPVNLHDELRSYQSPDTRCFGPLPKSNCQMPHGGSINGCWRIISTQTNSQRTSNVSWRACAKP
ncbi:MAG: hypothetical protein R2911_15845 [Caldilineaceae bacterium]